MAVRIQAQCPECDHLMLFDPHDLTTKTKCEECLKPFLPASSVVAPPPPQESSRRRRSRRDDDDEERLTSDNRFRHRTEKAFSTGFGFAFGNAMGRFFAFLVGLVIIGILLVIFYYVGKEQGWFSRTTFR